MRALVTGGAGFIGSTLCRRLIRDGFEVTNVDKLTYAGNLHSLGPIVSNPGYAFERADICDRRKLDQIFHDHQPDLVFHLAAESHVDRSISDPAAFVQTNLIGTYQLLEAAKHYWSGLAGSRASEFRFLHISTDEVFGSLTPGASRFCEETRYDPSSPYSASKAGSDHLAGAWARTYGLPVIICNCSNNYGPFQFPEKLIPLAILNALHDMAIPVYGDGSNVRDWLYVEDFVAGLIAAFERGLPGERYNFGGEGERTNLELVRTICAILDAAASSTRPRAELITFVPDRPGHDLRYAIDPTKARTQLGWRAQVDLQAGLERTVDWYMRNRDWWEPLRNNVYRGERLGLAGSPRRASL